MLATLQDRKIIGPLLLISPRGSATVCNIRDLQSRNGVGTVKMAVVSAGAEGSLPNELS